MTIEEIKKIAEKRKAVLKGYVEQYKRDILKDDDFMKDVDEKLIIAYQESCNQIDSLILDLEYYEIVG